MTFKITFIITILLTLTNCATSQFKVLDDNQYQLTKNSDACALGSPSSVLNHVRNEAVRFCAGKDKRMIEVEANSVMGIPIIRCTSGTLIFKCK